MNASPRNDEKGIKYAGEGKDVRNTLTTDYVREGSYMKIAAQTWGIFGSQSLVWWWPFPRSQQSQSNSLDMKNGQYCLVWPVGILWDGFPGRHTQIHRARVVP